jgi:diguanylate cyclase (GGDEF)-like protein
MMCDVDFFKNFNDTYGHQAGDNCLRLVAKTLGAFAKRPGDFVARYGGEEFAILLFGTKAQYAQGIAEAMNEAVSNLNITHETSSVHSVVTISIGLCDIIPTAEFEPKDLVNKADQALYQAKKTGRNRIVVNQWVS